MPALRKLAWVGLLGLLAACSKEKDVEPPAELVDFNATLAVERLWSLRTGGDEVLRLALAPVSDGERVFVAGSSGDVTAASLSNGRSLWRTRLDTAVSAGPAQGEGLVAVGTPKGMVIALDAETGAERWRSRAGGEVLARPAIGGGRVVTHTADGRVVGLAAADGRELWMYEQPVPRLTLRGSAPPVIDGDVVFAAFDNGKVVALSLEEGDVLWSATVAAPGGRTELERMVDIDSPVKVAGEDVFVVGFQGRAAMLARTTGQIWWGREQSSHRGLAIDDDALYVATADGVVVALSRRDGSERWRQDVLARRGLSAPAVDGDAIVLADFQGYLHWLDRGTGELLARSSTDGKRVTNTPVVVDGVVLVQTDAGGVYALRSRPRGSR
jgi:outer membrane protein assembly factor BamB